MSLKIIKLQRESKSG